MTPARMRIQVAFREVRRFIIENGKPERIQRLGSAIMLEYPGGRRAGIAWKNNEPPER